MGKDEVNSAMEDIGYRSKFKKPRPKEGESLARLCQKWATDPSTTDGRNATLALENGRQSVLEIIKQPGALEGMPKNSKIYFSQIIEFEEMWKRGEINSKWDYWMTKDEVMACCRNGKSYGRYEFNKNKNEWNFKKKTS